MKDYYHKLVLLTIIFLLYSSFIPAQSESDKLNKIISMKSSREKVDALQKFQNEYPGSPSAARTVRELINTFIDLNKIDSALYQADKFIKSLPDENKEEYYNDIAYMLAEKGAGLDTALAYSSRAVSLVQNYPRYLSMYKDTKAFVLYKKGDSQAALEIQKEAIKGHEDDPEYLYHLALFSEASGKLKDALKYSAQAVLLGDEGSSLIKFNEWGKKIEPSSKDSIIMDIVYDFINKTEGDDDKAARSNAAAFLAETGVNLELADKWSQDAVNSINKKTLVENYINFIKNDAIVKAAAGKNIKAMKELEKIKSLVDPWSSDYWLTLGKVYEKLNKKEKALNSYVEGLIASDNPILMESAEKFASNEEIQNKIEKMKDQLSSVNAGKFKSKNKNGNVVLAELFTGAECNPCVAADRAFDELSEYYPRSALVILEYHVHIPGPDPLTNPDGFKRYKWYGGNFGTPTVFFQGKEKITGGGPKFVTANRFNVYNFIIKKYFDENSEIQIKGKAELDKDKIRINVNLKGTQNKNGDLMLHIALAEKSVKYEGANGISRHIFVVRHIVDAQEGIRINSIKDTLSRQINISDLKEKISNYLKNPSTDASWIANSFHGWRSGINDLEKIHLKNLAVVAWVQNSNTKEVLQAHYMDVK